MTARPDGPPDLTPEYVAKLRQQLAEYVVPDGTVNVPPECVVVLRRTVEKLLDGVAALRDARPARRMESAGQKNERGASYSRTRRNEG